MKKLNLFAVVTLMSVLCTMMVGCDNKMDLEGAPAPRDTTHQPTPNTPTDTTKVDPYAWKDIMAKELNVDENRQVESKIIAQRNNGEKDSTILRYILGFVISAPDTIRLTQPGTEMTVYTGTLSFPVKDYTPTTVANCDSAIVVTTTKGYKTNYYDVTWKTSHVNGWLLFKGHMEPYKNSEETTTFSALSLYRDAYEIVRNDSVYLREEVKHEVKMFFLKRTFSFEKKVVVDHFLKIKEEQPAEPEKVNADVWVNNLKRFISCTKVWRDDSKSWSDAYLFECENTYEIILANYRVSDDKEKFVSVEHKSVSKRVCPESSEYNGVIQVGGNFYPAAITIQSDGWDVIGYINGKAESQTHADQFANNSGIKNQNKNNNAKPSPFITTTKVENKVNGKLVIKVTAKTTTHTGVFTVADSSLK